MDAASALPGRTTALRPAWRVTPLRLVIGLTLLAVAVRLVHIGSRPLWLDEAYSAWFASRSWHYLWTAVPTYEPHPPFYYSVLKLWEAIAGDSPVALRALSLLLSAATVPVVMAAAREFDRQRPSGRPLLAAGVTGFLFACGPMLVFLDQEARPYPMAILAYAVAVLALLRLMRAFAEGGSGTWRSWLLLGLSTEIVLWAHGLGLLYAACLGLALLPAWLGKPIPRARLVRGGMTAVIVMGAYLPCLLMVLSRTHDWGTGWLPWRPLMLLQLLDIYSVPMVAITVGTGIATLILVLLAFRAIVSANKAHGWNSERALVLLWFGPPLMAALVSQFVVPVFLARALSATIVPAYIAMGAALARTEGRRERMLLAGALAATLIPTAVQIASRPAPEPWDQVSAFVSRHAAPTDQVWLYPNDSIHPLNAAGLNLANVRGIPRDYPAIGFKGPIRAGSPAVVSLTAEQARQFATDRTISGVPVIWLVTRQSELFDPKAELPAALAQVRRPGPPTRWGYIGVQPFYRR